MESLPAVIGIITVAAITPGPNNFIVMAAAARGGMAAALPAMGGVVLGSLALLAIIWAGAGSAFEAAPDLRLVLRVLGALYLIWLGGMLVWTAGAGEGDGGGSDDRTLPSTAIGVAAFQLFNPKAWVLVLTATAAMASDPAGILVLATTFTVVSTPCLALWAFAGSAVSRWLSRPAPRLWFDRAMGALLVASAALLLV